MGADRNENTEKMDPEIFDENIFGRKFEQRLPSPTQNLTKKVFAFVDAPVTWFRETVLSNRDTQPYYHQKFRRVPTIDECHVDDLACMYEAHEQFKRDRKVDSFILSILRSRWSECIHYHGYDEANKCNPLKVEYEDVMENWFTKYGDLSIHTSCVDAYMKQKHRMVWERRQTALKEQQAAGSA